LLLGLAALANGVTATPQLRVLSSAFVGTAVLVFAIAAIRAVEVLRPRDYRRPTVDSLRIAPGELWDDSASDALRMVTKTQLTLLLHAESANDGKAADLDKAIRFEVGATVVLAVGAVLVLLGA
jgi:hypothetical protein